MSYDQRYDSDLLRGIEDPRPWDLLDVVRQYLNLSDVLLDIGCGTAAKLTKLAGNVATIYGLEPNDEMRTKAERNIVRTGVSNITLSSGRAEEIPFDDDFFDIVTAMVAPHNTQEAYRVLKPGRYCIIERTGDLDKYDLKLAFGSDEEGLRGQNLHYQGKMHKLFEEEFGRLFSEVSVQSGFWNSYLTMEGLILLLEQTPSVRGFDKDKDQKVLQRIKEDHSTNIGILIRNHRILIVAKK